jgi:hypothetical protein
MAKLGRPKKPRPDSIKVKYSELEAWIKLLRGESSRLLDDLYSINKEGSCIPIYVDMDVTEPYLVQESLSIDTMDDYFILDGLLAPLLEVQAAARIKLEAHERRFDRVQSRINRISAAFLKLEALPSSSEFEKLCKTATVRSVTFQDADKTVRLKGFAPKALEDYETEIEALQVEYRTLTFALAELKGELQVSEVEVPVNVWSHLRAYFDDEQPLQVD